MAFLSCKEEGIVYIFKFVLDCGTVVYKIGITGREEVYDRLSEILIHFLKVYRYVPRTSMKKFSKCKHNRLVEETLHKEFAEYSYKFDKKFGGYTEYFSGLDEEVLISRYEELIKKDLS